jgi:hypothetical protein
MATINGGALQGGMTLPTRAEVDNIPRGKAVGR